MIEFHDVSKIFRDGQGRDVAAVKALSLSIAAGETLCLIGTSGCGKTTILKLINRLIEPTTGSIHVLGNDVRRHDVIQLRRRIGTVVQRGGLFPNMTVAQNIGLLCKLERWDKPRIRNRVYELLTLVNLPPMEFAHRYPADLSGGQRQRVGVARSLALDPETILMDEPFGALDPITRDKLHDEFLQLKQAMNKTIVIVTHDMAEAFKLGDRVALMNDGELLQVGVEADFRDRPANDFVRDFLRTHLNGEVRQP